MKTNGPSRILMDVKKIKMAAQIVTKIPMAHGVPFQTLVAPLNKMRGGLIALQVLHNSVH